MSSIKVAVRCRPLFENEKPATGLDIQGRRILLDSKTYDPDYTFTPTCTQDDVLVVARPILQCVKDGLHGTIMVYGQTGTGKTYTMLGQEGADNGLVHKVIAEMLDHLQVKTRDGVKCALTLSMIEIYNEKLTDMLSANGEEEVALIGGFPRSTVKTTLCRISDANAAISNGLRWRHTAATMMNDRSSRSHVVFIVDFEQYNEYTEQMDVAHLFLVDLAGSESLKKSQASGTTATEAGKINKSLLALKSVFLALSNTSEATRPAHVPYRDSKLTELLQDSIGGTARTLMIACISSVGRDIEETKSTLMYAVKARSIRNAANTEKEKLLTRLRSLETENQKIRNRLQERVSERGGYYVTKEEHDATQRLEEEVAELRDGVTQLLRDRQTSEAHQHISESQQKILLVMIEEKEEKLRQFHGVYHDALHRFEHQAHTLQRLVQLAVQQSKTALQSSSDDTLARLAAWKRQMLALVDTAATEEPAPPLVARAEAAGPVRVSDGKAEDVEPEEEQETEWSDETAEAHADRAGSPVLSALSAPPPTPASLGGGLAAAMTMGSRRSSPAPLHVRGALNSQPASQRGSVVSTTATAPVSQVSSPARAAAPGAAASTTTSTTAATGRAGRAWRRGLSASRTAQSLFGASAAAVKDSGNGRPVPSSSPAPTPTAVCVDEEEPVPVVGPVVGPAGTSSSSAGAAATVVVSPCFLAELDDECRRIVHRLNASFRELAEACVEAAQRHVQATQAIHAQRQARSQHSLDALRQAFEAHAANLDKAERSAAQDLESAEHLFLEETRARTTYPEPLAARALQQLARSAAAETVRTAEMAFPSSQPSHAVESTLDALVRGYQQKLRETTVAALVPLSANALDLTTASGSPTTARPFVLAPLSAAADVLASAAMPPLVPSSVATAETAPVGPEEVGEGSPNWHKDSNRSTQSQRGSSVPSSTSTMGPVESASPRTGSARGRLMPPQTRATATVATTTMTAATATSTVRTGAAATRKPRLPFGASVPRDTSKSRARESSTGRLQSLPGNTTTRGTQPGEKRSRSSLSASGAGNGGGLSGRHVGEMESKKRRSVSDMDSQK